MDEQTGTRASSGGEAELPPRWALERAELQSDVDALVHQALAGLLKSAEDLKQRIREETLAEVQQGKLEREAVQREIEEARQELEEVRGGNRAAAEAEIEQEREAILAEARAEGERIVDAAKAERESLLEEIRASQHKLREFQEQVQSLLGLGGGAAASAASAPPATAEPAAPRTEASIAAPSTPVTPAVSSEPQPMSVESSVVHEPPVAHETPVVPEAPAPPTNFSGLIDSKPETPVAASTPTPPAPVTPEPAAPAGPRTMQLIFTNVPGYQQAAAIERTTRQLPDVSNVDVQEFERGRLVLEVQAGNPSALADAMVSSAPAAMSVADRSANAITFQLN
jgi:hypothetical protein